MKIKSHKYHVFQYINVQSVTFRSNMERPLVFFPFCISCYAPYDRNSCVLYSISSYKRMDVDIFSCHFKCVELTINHFPVYTYTELIVAKSTLLQIHLINKYIRTPTQANSHKYHHVCLFSVAFAGGSVDDDNHDDDSDGNSDSDLLELNSEFSI